MKIDRITARLKEADSPSRELDADIARLIGYKVYVYGHSGPHIESLNSEQIECPRFTASLDECDTLFKQQLPGYVRALHNSDGIEQAVICNASNSKNSVKYTGTGSTGAIAYLIAILEALKDNSLND